MADAFSLNMSIVAVYLSDRNRIYQNGRIPTLPNVHPERANWQTFFHMCKSNLPFSGHIVNTFRKPTIRQLIIEGLTTSKMNVLHHLAVQHEALVVLQQENHSAPGAKLILPSFTLVGSPAAGSMALPHLSMGE